MRCSKNFFTDFVALDLTIYRLIKKFMENHTLADGRNALNAFEQAKTAAIQQRLREVIAEDIDFVSQYEGDEFGKG